MVPFTSVTSKVFVVVPSGKILPLAKPAVCTSSPLPRQSTFVKGPSYTIAAPQPTVVSAKAISANPVLLSP